MQIKLEHLTKRFGDTVAVNDLSITLESGKLIALLGPSGCGKTTTLNMISGILPVSGGSIFFDDRDVTSLPPEKRGIGLVFQNYALYPHMTVLQNICFPMEIQRIPKKERIRRAEELAEMVHITPYLKRKPAELSGGQQQRVAIARALVTGPSIICMDEPLSNLDAKLRVQLRNELKKMQREFGITTIYVTHDQEEALTLSDRIAVFNKGYIEQIGTPNEIYNHSKTEFVCNFIGDINRVEAPIAAKMKLAAGQNHFIRLERLHVNKPKRDDEILIDGVVENIEYYGLYIKYYIDVGSQILKAIEKNDGINIYAPGEKVTVAMKPTDVMSYDAQ